jgi:hypothetical protein
MTVFSQILYTQWKWIRFGLAPLVLVAFSLPVFTTGRIDAASVWSGFSFSNEIVINSTMVAPIYPLAAAVTGVVLALSAWFWDHHTGHTYALSLPVSRSSYSVQRMAAGAVLLLLPALGLCVGALLARASVDLPDPLRAYPFGLSFRYYLASLTAFAVFFALAAGTMRTAVAVISVVPALFVLEALFGAFGIELHIMQKILDVTTHWPGPFEVFGGSWMLFDV